ncbi:MAG: DUF6785 family protein [Phycisphaerae bacterium]
MTLRAIIIGALAAIGLAGLGYVSHQVDLPALVHNHFPVFIFGLLVLLAMVINPLLYFLAPKGRKESWRFSAGELAVITGFLLATASIPGAGLMRHLTAVTAMPKHHNRMLVGWRSHQILDYAPYREVELPVGETVEMSMLAGRPGETEQLLEGFVGSGLGKPGDPIGPDEIPWEQWIPALVTWAPMILLMAVGVISMAMVVHRQWSSHERLRYPIAMAASTMMQQDTGRPLGTIFRNRTFWLGFGAIFLVHLIRGTYAWDLQGVDIPLSFDLKPVYEKYPDLISVDGGWSLLHPTFSATAVAFGFLLASDVSLSLGLSQAVHVALLIFLVGLGVDVSFNHMTGGVTSWQLFGSYLGVGLLLLYTGRRYYAQVLKLAINFGRSSFVENSAVWAARFFILSVAGLVGMLVVLGLDWPLAIIAVLLIMLVFLVMSRINAESGLFFIMPHWQATAVLLGLFGTYALGPGAVVIVGLMCAVFTIETRECLMPYVVNALKIGDDNGVKPSRMGPSIAGLFAVGLLIAIPVVLWSNYNYGIKPGDWETDQMPQFTFNAAEQTVTELDLADRLGESEQLNWFERIQNIDPKDGFVLAAGVGLVLAVGFSALRLRYSWWPIHPIIFLVWGTYPMYKLSHSFLLGWVLKTAITRLGGAGRYRGASKFFMGAIAGDLLAGLLFMLVAWAYYAVMGVKPPHGYNVFPF